MLICLGNEEIVHGIYKDVLVAQEKGKDTFKKYQGKGKIQES